MAEDATAPEAADLHDLDETPPPPLTDIRVRPPGARGLNKKAIIITAGGAGLVILGLASLNVSTDGSRKPAQPALQMSAPARPEMAKGAVGGLPATYAQAAEFERARQPVPPQSAPAQPAPPQLGPPMPGDIAAFATEAPPGWREDGDDAGNFQQRAGASPDPAAIEAKEADRSALFYNLRAASAPTPVMPAVQQRPPQTLQQPTAKAVASGSPLRLGSNRALFPGAVIPASLITAINSEAPGPVIAQVTQTVYDSATGRTMLIPQGARLIGDYRSATRFGQYRIVILWSRLIMPDGEEIALEEPAVDANGAAAIPGTVDDHWLDLLGAATLGTLINIGVASTEDPQLTYRGFGGSTRDPVDEAIAEGVQRSASSMTSRVVDRSLALPPTIRVEAGKRIAVMVSRRLEVKPA